MRSKRKLRLRDVMAREGKSERTIARDIERNRCPKPHYDEAGIRWWWESEWDANDRRLAALNLGPKHRPPAPTNRKRRNKLREVARVRR